MKAFQITLLILIINFSTPLCAKVDVLFHPYDDTFKAIIERMKSAQTSIDMALYNMDDSQRNPIIKYLSSPAVQERINSGELNIRLLFEGFESKEQNLKKMLDLEKIGIDARALKSSKKMHHKFAVIDGFKSDSSVITGSANWSMSSRLNFNENILYFDNEGAISQMFAKEFNDLWNVAKEVGTSNHFIYPKMEKTDSSPINIFFNIENFNLSKKSISKKRGDQGFRLTKEIVRAIDSAKNSINIATTRFKLRPIYNAVLRAAKRGVQVNIIVTMGEYEWFKKRRALTPRTCQNEFERKCSTSQNFAAMLSNKNFPGSENVEVRLKFFNIKTGAYLNKQMHSKYIIIDQLTLLTGSFNWSYSSEFNHIENIVKVESRDYPAVLRKFEQDFSKLWDLRRSNLEPLQAKIKEALRLKRKIKCGFPPMVLEYPEVDSLLRRGRSFCQ